MMNNVIVETTTREYKTTPGHRAAQAAYLVNNRDKSHKWCKDYYQKNKASIREKQKLRYYRIKSEKLALLNNNANTPDISIDN